MPSLRSRWLKLFLLASGALAVAAAVLLAIPRSRGVAVDALRTVWQRVDAIRPDVAWETAAPEAHGIDAACLAELRAEMAERRTEALLVARDGRLVEEWYAPGRTVDRHHYTAALTKALAGSMALALALEDGRVALDDPVSEYVRAWRGEPRKASITLAQLASHSSGLEDVSFEGPQEGWHSRYYDHADERFALALSRGSLIAPPGERYSYSGMGFYVLSYALRTTLEGSEYPHLRAWLRERLMRPMEIDDDAWRISYGDTYRYDGMQQVAIGSGGAYTPRAAARIGQLVADRGRYEGRALLAPEHVARLTEPHSPEPRDREAPRAGLGWWVNHDGFWPALPRDAAVGAGLGHQLLLVVPSERLVAVRLGDELEKPRVWAAPYWEAAGEHLFAPLMACVRERREDAAENAH